MPSHEHINNFSDEINWYDYLSSFEFRNRFFFFSGEIGFTLDPTLVSEHFNNIGIQFIYPNFRFQIDDALDDKTLVIHLRGGDVFETNCPHKNYVQNPLSFYKKIIPSYNEIIIVAEPINSSPLLPYLLDMPNTRLVSGSLTDDFAMMLRARNLVSSGVGTFSMAAALCSPNLRNFFCSDLFLDTHLNPKMLDTRINLQMMPLPNYIDVGNWTFNDDYLKLMLDYKF
jgi:hypothetical protein